MSRPASVERVEAFRDKDGCLHSTEMAAVKASLLKSLDRVRCKTKEYGGNYTVEDLRALRTLVRMLHGDMEEWALKHGEGLR